MYSAFLLFPLLYLSQHNVWFLFNILHLSIAHMFSSWFITLFPNSTSVTFFPWYVVRWNPSNIAALLSPSLHCPHHNSIH
ncbi:hypothetical protein F5J12DRAFT_840118 [Pisolithus orientalis]|uniref:uncharacterized protein n=1 Tax=Pisolithus orientalis TaxID=936130 RepID=UPI00222593F0|nr:uncharacterized protein F5J12DRAFT_840118 [Pisolithus orientalis]KAI6002607.1 hypothetical protein F5J12DRAFT_840118 [Pisolithus orientalis]